MDFETLQKSWMEQQLPIPHTDESALEQAMQQWEKQTKAAKRINLLLTVTLGIVAVVLVWVYAAFHHSRSVLFGLSLLTMIVLMGGYIIVLWKGTTVPLPDAQSSEVDFLKQHLRKLHWRRKTITTYTNAYMILLWLAVMLYMSDVLAELSTWIKIAVPLAVTLYILGLHLLIKKKSRTKQLNNIDTLINRFENILNNDD